MNRLSLFERFLVFYGVTFPEHPRKWWVHGKLRQLIATPKNIDIEVERNGLRWLLNPSDFEHEGLFWLGGADPWDLFHLCSFKQKDTVFYDIGANLGHYSLVFANHKKMQCRIQAFEPNPKTFELLSKHVAMNNMENRVFPNRLALSSSAGTGTLIERPDNSGASRLGTDAPGIPVAVSTLDLFCSQRDETRLDVVKIDVEGYEVQVLEGGRATLTRFKPMIIVEFWTPGLSRAGATVDDIAACLASMGYTLFIPAHERLVPVTDLPRGEVPVNIFAIHPERR